MAQLNNLSALVRAAHSYTAIYLVLPFAPFLPAEQNIPATSATLDHFQQEGEKREGASIFGAEHMGLAVLSLLEVDISRFLQGGWIPERVRDSREGQLKGQLIRFQTLLVTVCKGIIPHRLGIVS
jgi:hypothetical protein